MDSFRLAAGKAICKPQRRCLILSDEVNEALEKKSASQTTALEALVSKVPELGNKVDEMHPGMATSYRAPSENREKLKN